MAICMVMNVTRSYLNPATNHPFRATGEEAMSYFVAPNSINTDKAEAKIRIAWWKRMEKGRFDNHKITFDGTTALAMALTTLHVQLPEKLRLPTSLLDTNVV